ncbi:MAG: hypothetical protein JWM78_3385 [Verrucomicrobiaceae bacterium]|nr:hypothetical protein [Verrucomicrobiaceae bacterium]
MYALPSPIATVLILLPLFLWRIYSRFRRLVGRQQLSAIRPWITMIAFPLLIVFLGTAAPMTTERFAWIAGGLSVGTLLGLFGLNKTRFEASEKGLFYTPNAHLGIALSLAFIGRIIYRVVDMFVLNPTAVHNMNDLGQSMSTLAIFSLLAGYYVTYAVGLTRWRCRIAQLPNSQSSASL